MRRPDPLAVLAAEQPEVSGAQAVQLLKDYYGLDATVNSLVSERDRNYLATDSAGSQYVLKIANSAEPEEVTDFQVQALLYVDQAVAESAIPITTPKIVRTIDDECSFRYVLPNSTNIVRLVTYIPGRILEESAVTSKFALNFGIYLARLGRALRGFDHQGSGHSLLWDMQQALQLRDLSQYISEPDAAKNVTEALDDFERYALPAYLEMRTQVIHNDMNLDNVLVDPSDHNQPAGIIDFGDMLKAPLITDVAVAGSYLRPAVGNPLALIGEFVSGYHSVTALSLDEIDLIFELIQARLCASIAIPDWRASLRGSEDPYLAARVTGQGSARHFLGRLRDIPRAYARSLFRQVCASAKQHFT